MAYYNNKVIKKTYTGAFYRLSGGGFYSTAHFMRCKLGFFVREGGENNRKMSVTLKSRKGRKYSAWCYMGYVPAGKYKTKKGDDNKAYWVGSVKIGNGRYTVHFYDAEYTPTNGKHPGVVHHSCRMKAVYYRKNRKKRYYKRYYNGWKRGYSGKGNTNVKAYKPVYKY